MNCTVWFCPRCETNNHITEDYCPTCGIKYTEVDKTINEDVLIKRKILIDCIKKLETENWTLERQIKQNKKSIESFEYEIEKVQHG